MPIKLTASLIKDMAPDAKVSFLWDTAVRGLGVRRTPSAVKSFVFRYRTKNRFKKQRLVTLGRVDEITLDAARAKAQILRAEVAKGNDPADHAKMAAGLPTVRDLAKRYTAEYAPRKRPSSQKNDALLWGKHIIPLLGDILVAELDTADVMALQNALIENQTTANRAVALFSKAMSLAEVWGWRPQNTNPCQQIKKFPENKRQRILSRGELARFGARLAEIEAKHAAGWQYVDLLRLLLVTGCRRDEWRLGRWEWINGQDGTYSIPVSKTGAKKVYLSNAAKSVLNGILVKRKLAQIPKSGFIFPSRKSRHRALAWSHAAWTRFIESIGLENLRVHDLRHTVGSYAHASGLSQKRVADLLGHKRMETAGRYIHDESRQETADIAGHALELLLQG